MLLARRFGSLHKHSVVDNNAMSILRFLLVPKDMTMRLTKHYIFTAALLLSLLLPALPAPAYAQAEGSSPDQLPAELALGEDLQIHATSNGAVIDWQFSPI